MPKPAPAPRFVLTYPVRLEVAGPAAMWTRPDTGGTPASYPVPTRSACKGLFESIARLASGGAWIEPTAVEICRPVGAEGGVRFQRYTTNYGGPLRKGTQISGDNNFQLIATILSDVHYRLHGEVAGLSHDKSRGGKNSRHHLQDLFNRRLRQGRCFRTPCLGWSEFTCSYWGPFRNGWKNGDDESEKRERVGDPVTEVDDSVTVTIPSMLDVVWDRRVRGRYAPTFRQDVEVAAGMLKFPWPGKDELAAVTAAAPGEVADAKRRWERSDAE